MNSTNYIHKAFLINTIITLTFVSLCTYGQNFEVGVASGTANYFGDIGISGANNSDIAFDIQSQNLKTSFGTYVRYNMSPKIAVRANAFYGKVSASDKNANEASRVNRNLHFRSNIYEMSLQTEITILKKDIFSKSNPKHKEAKANREKINDVITGFAQGNQIAFYGFTGIGIFHFNPQAEYKGVWYDLMPLGTEGQGIISNENQKNPQERYSLNETVIPMGIGMYYQTQNGVKVGFEVGYRKTYTDYLDDVSNVYADPEVIEAAHGSIAAALSNRSAEVVTDKATLANYTKGAKRGNPNSNDSYVFTMLTLSYNISGK